MSLKEQIELVEKRIQERGASDLILKIGEIKGLYSACQIAPSNALFEEISIRLTEIILALLDVSAASCVVEKKTPYLDLFDMFEIYLSSPEGGCKNNTPGAYARAMRRVFERMKEIFGISSPDEITIEMLDEMRGRYGEADKKGHSQHTCAIKRFIEFLLRLKEYAQNPNNNEPPIWLTSDCQGRWQGVIY